MQSPYNRIPLLLAGTSGISDSGSDSTTSSAPPEAPVGSIGPPNFTGLLLGSHVKLASSMRPLERKPRLGNLKQG